MIIFNICMCGCILDKLHARMSGDTKFLTYVYYDAMCTILIDRCFRFMNILFQYSLII